MTLNIFLNRKRFVIDILRKCHTLKFTRMSFQLEILGFNSFDLQLWLWDLEQISHQEWRFGLLLAHVILCDLSIQSWLYSAPWIGILSVGFCKGPN